MKSILVLAILSSVVLAQVPKPFNFNWRDLKNIWELPRLQPALKNITSRNGIDTNEITNLPRIVGGDVARLGQFPFSKLLVIEDMWWCGGSLINANWVLTAAHCLYGLTYADIYTIVDLNDGYYWWSPSAKLISHEHYDEEQITYDIGLINLAIAAPNNFYTSYINLPRNQVGNSFTGYNSTIQGFGVYSDASGYVSEVKRYVSQIILGNANCYWRPNGDQLCTDTTNRTGPCNGDSGGGLFIGDIDNHSSERYVCGIVSYGALAGCELGYPAVFTRVTSFLDWIDRHIAAQ